MLKRLLLASAVAFTPASAHAQTAPSRIAPPTRADQAPAVAPPPQTSQAGLRSPPSGPKVTPFVLRSVEIAGSTLPPARLEAAWRPFIGATLDDAGVQALSDAVAKVYEASDIAIYTVLIPDQDLLQGALRVKVLEGWISDVRINGRPGRAVAKIEAHAGRLEGRRPLAKSDLQRQISLIRDIPGLTSEMDLLNGGVEDAVILSLNPKLRPVQVGLAVNNRGTFLLGKTQVQGDLIFNSGLRSGDQTRLTLAAPTNDDLFRFAALSHSTPIGSNGDSLLLTGTYLRTRPATTALLGRATSAGVQYSRPIIRSFERDLYLNVGVDGVDSENALFGQTFSNDSSRAARLSIAYGLTKSRSQMAVVGSYSQGIDAWGAQTGSPLFTDLDFGKINIRASYNRALGDRAAVRLKAAAQWAEGFLPGSEQFSIGGADYGRAYESGAASGDHGYAGSAELAYRPAFFQAALAGSELYGFADGGKTTYKARGLFQESDYSLGSAGAGVRLTVKNRAVLEIEAARGTHGSPDFLSDRSWRAVFNLKTIF